MVPDFEASPTSEHPSTPQHQQNPTVIEVNSPLTSCSSQPAPNAPQLSRDHPKDTQPTHQPAHAKSPSPFNDSYRSTSPSLLWSRLPPIRNHRSHISRHLFSDTPPYSFDMPPQMWSFWQWLERRLDYLTRVLKDLQSASHNHLP